MHAHAHHDHRCIIFAGNQAEKLKSDLIRDRCIIMFHDLEKITLLYGWSYKCVLPQLIFSLLPLDKNRHKATIYAKHRRTNHFGSCRRKIASPYFNHINRLGSRAERCVPVANTVGESFLLRCLLEKEIFEFCLVREILRGNSPVC